jgi:predicted nucleic acid-binding protein
LLTPNGNRVPFRLAEAAIVISDEKFAQLTSSRAISDRIALEWGRLSAERPRGMADGLITATALVHAKIIVTRNVEDFSDGRVPVISPWSP